MFPKLSVLLAEGSTPPQPRATCRGCPRAPFDGRAVPQSVVTQLVRRLPQNAMRLISWVVRNNTYTNVATPSTEMYRGPRSIITTVIRVADVRLDTSLLHNGRSASTHALPNHLGVGTTDAPPRHLGAALSRNGQGFYFPRP